MAQLTQRSKRQQLSFPVLRNNIGNSSSRVWGEAVTEPLASIQEATGSTRQQKELPALNRKRGRSLNGQ